MSLCRPDACGEAIATHRMFPLSSGNLARSALIALMAAACPQTAYAQSDTPAIRRKSDAAVGMPSQTTPLTRVADIRTGDPAMMGRDVRIEGVVTYADAGWGLLFVQDHEEGVFVQMKGQSMEVAPGDRVRVEGRSAAGDFAPIVEHPRVTRLGAGELPRPASPSFQEMLSGDWDSQFVELDGIVRGVRPVTSARDNHLYFDVAVGTWRVIAQLPGRWTGQAPEHLVDARVRIRGVAGTLFNPQRQLVGLQLFIPSLDLVTTLEASRPDPFSAPVYTIGSLNRWASRHGVGRRVRIRGEVTWAQRNQIYVRDMSGSIAVTLWAPADVRAGEQVDAAGFVAAGTYSPTLEDAVVRRGSKGAETAAPLRVTADELMSGRHDAGLVTLDAEVVNQVLEPEPLLVLKTGDQVFTAPGPPTARLEVFEPGTLVSVTGVCRVQVDPLDSPRVPRGVQLLLRTADDVRLTRRAALSPRRTVQALGLLFAMVLAGLAWIVGLRRRVAQQTQDLREQLDRERALEAQYRELVATANDLVVTCDADARVTSINDAGQKLTGQSAETAVGRPLRELVAPSDRARLDCEIAAALASRSGARLEVAIAPIGGAGATVELDVRPIYRRGRPGGLQAIGRDVTARKHTEAQLAEARDAAEAASRAKSEFMANISHEVRTPLTGIIGMTELVLAGPMAEQARQYLSLVRSSADTLLHVINDLLDFSKVEAGHLHFEHAAFDLPARLSATLEPLAVTARRKGLTFSIEQDPSLPSVLVGDAARFGQVVTNLVGNAIKFTDEGSVRVAFDIAPARPGDGSGLVRLRAAVHDTGIGIPADKHALIFEAFTQADGSTSRRFGGTGLGLSIAASIVKRMGGSVDVQSEPGRGSVFTLVVPFERGTAAALPILSTDGLSRPLGHADTGAPSEAETAQPMRVLLVEDNLVNQRLAHEVLRCRGHHVSVASGLAFNLAEALQRVDGDRDLLAEIAAIFLADAPAMLEDLAAAVASRDALAVSRTAHRLKGSILTFSAPEAASAAVVLETSGRTGDMARVDEDLAALTSAMKRLDEALGAFIEERRKSA